MVQVSFSEQCLGTTCSISISNRLYRSLNKNFRYYYPIKLPLLITGLIHKPTKDIYEYYFITKLFNDILFVDKR